MNALEKLQVLGAGASYDKCGCECGVQEAKKRKRILPKEGIYPAMMPDGRRSLLLKVLQSNKCENDCRYCGNRCGREVKRVEFAPRELANLFFKYFEEGYVEGLFLSSGISSGESMDKILETVSLVRKGGFRGYIHTKILPGASRDQVKYAAQLSTRLSINVEAPSKSRLGELSSQKDFGSDILRRMRWIQEEERKGKVRGGQTTQFIVGAANESDQEILKMVNWLYKEMRVNRSYFSAFRPIERTPLERHPRTPSLREHRLYQADFLLRKYGFKFRDLIFEDDDNLSQREDPKFRYAMENKDIFPIDLRGANFKELILVPGIGPRTAKRIMEERKSREIKKLIPKKSFPFLEIDGKRQLKLLN